MPHASGNTPANIHSYKPALPPASSILNKTPSATQHDQLVTQTQKWVAQTFYGTLLKQVRQSPFHSNLFDGGRGGQAFGSLQDQQMAEHMARGAGQKLVNQIVRRIEAKQAYRKSSGSTDLNAGPDTPKSDAPKSDAPDAEQPRSGYVPANLRA